MSLQDAAVQEMILIITTSKLDGAAQISVTGRAAALLAIDVTIMQKRTFDGETGKLTDILQRMLQATKVGNSILDEKCQLKECRNHSTTCTITIIIVSSSRSSKSTRIATIEMIH